MKLKVLTLLTVCLLASWTGYAQNRQREMYGDETREVKMNYVHSLEQAWKDAYRQKKLIFVNCHADWAAPCLGMNQFVFSDEEFCRYMDKTFVNLFVDISSPEGK